MDLQFYGANCVTITTKDGRVVVDDNLADLGVKTVTKTGDIALFTLSHGLPSVATKLVIDYPGEYDVSNISITGMALQSHLDEPNHKSSIGYKILVNDINILVTGHISGRLTEAQLEQIGRVDILIIPTGGNGYTLDPIGALQIIKAIKPHIIVPTHYEQKDLNYPVPQQNLQDVLHGLAMEPAETLPKLRVKSSEFGDGMQLIVLE